MNYLTKYDQLLERYYRHICIGSLAVVLLLGIGLFKAQFTSELRAYFSDDNPQLQAFEALEADFNKQDSILFLVQPDDGDIYSRNTLNALISLTEKAWSLPYSRRVLSLVNLPHTKTAGDAISSDVLIDKNWEWSPESARHLRNSIQNDETYHRVVSSDGKSALVAIPVELPDGETRASIKVVEAAKDLRKEITASYPNLSIHLNGTVYANYNIEKAVIQDISILVPATSTVIFVLLMLVLRVLSGTILVMSLISLTAVGTFGFFSWLAIPLTPVSGTIPTTLTLIAVADCIHFLVTYYHELGAQHSKQKAVLQSLRINFLPMFLTSITTAIGLLCLNFSDSPPYRQLGNTVAFGAIIAFALTIAWLPAILLWLPSPKGFNTNRNDRISNRNFYWMESLGKLIIRHNQPLMISTGIVAILISINMANNQIDDQWDKYFDESFEITTSFEKFEDSFGGAHFIDFSARSTGSQAIFEPEYLQDLENLSDWLAEQPEVGRVEDFSSRVKLINKALHEDDPNQYVIPNSKTLISQAVLLYELSLPYGMSIGDQVNLDRSATKVTAFIASISSEEIIALEQRTQKWAKENLSTIDLTEGTGIDLVFAHMAQRNSYKLLSGTLVAMVLISAILLLVFKSIKLGAISLIPNLIPIFSAYGIWALTDGKIDLALSIVGALSLGLVVDDTIHFLSKYKYARTTLQLDTEGAILYAFKTVGLAMVITSAILAIGFLTLTLSHFYPTWNIGILLPITITLALAFDFLLLPGLLLLFDRKAPKKNHPNLKFTTQPETFEMKVETSSIDHRPKTSDTLLQ